MAFRTCLEYAHQTVVSVDEYFRREDLHVLGEWYGLYVMLLWWTESRTDLEHRYSIFQASLVSIIAMLTDLGFVDLEVWFGDIQNTRQILSRLSARSEQASQLLNVINRLCPEPTDGERSAIPSPSSQPDWWQELHTNCMDILNDRWPTFTY